MINSHQNKTSIMKLPVTKEVSSSSVEIQKSGKTIMIK